MRILSVLFVLMLAACVDASPATAPQPHLGFDQMKEIGLNVAKIEVSNEYKAPVADGHVEEMFATTPAAATQDLLDKKLKAEGSENILRVIIDDASVVEQKLPVASDFWSNFSREPSERYNARVALRFELVNEQAPDIIIGHASVIGQRTKTVLEDTSPADRDRAFLDLSEDLMGDVYNGLDTVVRSTFARQ